MLDDQTLELTPRGWLSRIEVGLLTFYKRIGGRNTDGDHDRRRPPQPADAQRPMQKQCQHADMQTGDRKHMHGAGAKEGPIVAAGQ